MQSAAQLQARPFVAVRATPCKARRSIVITAAVQRSEEPQHKALTALLSLAASAALVLGAGPASADLSNVRLPPLDNDPNRCARGFVGNTIGQANAVSDKPLDLRYCDFRGADLRTKTLSGAFMVDTDFSGADMRESVMSKAFALGANLSGADLTNSVIDRVVLDKANLTGAKLVNAVITGTTFEGTNLTDVNFEDALIGSEDAKRLCLNKTLVGESRDQVGCRN